MCVADTAFAGAVVAVVDDDDDDVGSRALLALNKFGDDVDGGNDGGTNDVVGP